MHTNHPRHSRAHTLASSALSRGFTLLEMVIVLGIIAVLLGGSIALLSGIPNAARMQQVEADFRAIGSALQAYRINAGNYPTNSQGLQALVSAPEKSGKWVQVMDGLPNDPWGTPYSYKYPGTRKPGQFELISAGEDRQPGTDDDVSSQDR
jgi:general secretion pathway protein G